MQEEVKEEKVAWAELMRENIKLKKQLEQRDAAAAAAAQIQTVNARNQASSTIR